MSRFFFQLFILGVWLFRFLFGYQTMDALGGGLFTLVIIKTVQKNGHTSVKSQLGVIGPACMVAVSGLFLVYGGLFYLGATTSQLNLGELNQTALVVKIVEMLLKKVGVIMLGVIVLFACLTTAIGLSSAAAHFFQDLLKDRVSYKVLIAVICVMGVLISNIGIDSIIAFASPILSVLFPVLLTQVAAAFFNDRIRNEYVNRVAALGALLTTIADTAADMGAGISLVNQLPLAGIGFGWLLPAILGGVIGALIPRKDKRTDK